MDDMLSIGEIAHSTGVSRRMLRHWEELGLIDPASVEPSTGHRRYEPSQIGRVNAVTNLRALGFGLEAIRDLLDARLTEPRLLEQLRTRERKLLREIDEAQASLSRVQSRLASVEKGHRTIVSTLQLMPLPALRLSAVRATVRDEAEIPLAARQVIETLRAQLPGGGEDRALVLTYDGTADDSIVVTVGVEADVRTAELDLVDVCAVQDGVSVRFEEPPADMADAWLALDSELEDRGLRTTGVYRQITTPGGAVTLQAGVRTVR